MASSNETPTAETDEFAEIMTISHSLTDPKTIVKMSFLFGDLLQPSDFKYLTSNPSAEANILNIKLLMEAVVKRKSLTRFQLFDVLAEMLYLARKYKALKELQICKHQMKERFLKTGLYLSSDFRRFLLSVCDELTDEDVAYIWSRVQDGSSNAEPAQAEFLFQWMLEAQQIGPEDVEKLSLHFQVMERSDLLQKVDNYKRTIGDADSMDLYDLSPVAENEPCGLALIFNFSTFTKVPHRSHQDKALKKLDPRQGTDIDADKLEKVWKTFGIKVDRIDNATCMQLEDVLNKTFTQDLTSIKIFIICILSHGHSGVAYCSDRVPFEISSIEQLLGTAPSLANKPKLLFIQACQGRSVQEVGSSRTGVVAGSYQFDAPEASPPTEFVVPQYSDMLIGTATVPGFMSIRSTTQGTHYIQSLGELLLEKGDKVDLTQLLVMVNHRVMRKTATMKHKGRELLLLQMPNITNRLSKSLIFKRAPLPGSV